MVKCSQVNYWFENHFESGNAFAWSVFSAGSSLEPNDSPRESIMEVNGPSPIRSSVPIQPTGPAGDIRGADGMDSVEPQDNLEISPAARMLEELDQVSELHQARLDRIKEEIQNGTYESPEKLEAALWNLMKQIESE
jgi:negative regulator of flagellin synthesis FlgM